MRVCHQVSVWKRMCLCFKERSVFESKEVRFEFEMGGLIVFWKLEIEVAVGLVGSYWGSVSIFVAIRLEEEMLDGRLGLIVNLFEFAIG